MNKGYPLQKSGLYRMRNRRKLAGLLQLPPDFFRRRYEVVYNLSIEPKQGNKGYRRFFKPEKRLKKIQKQICKLLTRIETPEWLHSGKKGRSYLTNAESHQEGKYIRKMDISAFYESTRKADVYRMFMNTFLMADDIAKLMTYLVTYEGIIPTGCPTSLIVAFWTYKEMFEEINTVALKYGCIFTLYVDDMTFSSQRPIPRQMHDEVERILKRYKFISKRSKDRYYQGKESKVITGVVIKNGEKCVLNKHRKKIIEQYRLYKDNGDNRSNLMGMLGVARHVEPIIFQGIYDSLKKSDSNCDAGI